MTLKKGTLILRRGSPDQRPSHVLGGSIFRGMEAVAQLSYAAKPHGGVDLAQIKRLDNRAQSELEQSST